MNPIYVIVLQMKDVHVDQEHQVLISEQSELYTLNQNNQRMVQSSNEGDRSI